MKSFPMFIRCEGRRIVIAGGGEQAAQKARLMLKTEGRIVLLAPSLDPELAALVAADKADHDSGPVTAASFADAAMCFIGTGCPGLDAALHALAKSAGALVNVVDQPDLCDITTPSLVDRDPVVVAIGTEGTAPVLARQIKTDIEAMLPPTLGGFAALAGRLRSAVAAKVPKADRRAFWRWVFAETPRATWVRGAEREAASLLKHAIAAGGAPRDTATVGSIALVGAGPGARDLLTLRAVQRLQEADVIFYDRLVDPDVLELARRDAERVFVGKVVGASAWPQERIDAVIVAAAKAGKRVVRLKSGDPMIYGRATEEMAAADANGIEIEVVPGITAASAAAAALHRSLTERGQTDTLVFATGACRAGDPQPDWGRHAREGTTLAYYMAVGAASEVQASILASGVGPQAEVHIAASVSTPRQQLVSCTLGTLPATLTAHAIRGQAVLLVRVPKALAAPVHVMPRALRVAV
ncbi:siroheme synthase CysG [Puniceibacterium sp. IMCC21224]|uniref:siroheme synthase CysG n=1 Tax=Puniceibacterium sp. IMCC21224 TaxID=1618204 RepID=UPI00064DDFA8|nr:siroheme synthase CysG [Puniceibacterium sp. IMCC21224]KMK68014.1 uroporphyrin-III C-methyltransferase [Puniceibacterium sp. IMCC21224]